MPRRKKIPLLKGKKHVRYKKGVPEVYQNLYCGECEAKTKPATTQRNAEIAKRENLPRLEEVARVCDKVEDHKEGKKHFWPVGEVIIHDYLEHVF